jgi:hypothetical protein
MENVQIFQELQEGIVDLTVKSQNGRYIFDTRTDASVMDLLDSGIAYEKDSHAIKNFNHANFVLQFFNFKVFGCCF